MLSRSVLDREVQIKLIGARRRQELAKVVWLSGVTLVHTAYKSSFEQRILTPEKMENHRTAGRGDPFQG